MVLLTLLAMAVVLSSFAALAIRGLRDGDLAEDPTVAVGLERTPAGAWIEVRIDNPSPEVALVGAQVARASRLAGKGWHRGAGRSRRVRLQDQTLAAVEPHGSETLWLFADGDPRRRRLVATVGLPGRLRVHRVALAWDEHRRWRSAAAHRLGDELRTRLAGQVSGAAWPANRSER